MRQIALDTETTGQHTKFAHRIIEIGCVELIDRRMSGKEYHTYLNPEREVDRQAYEIHGLSDEFLADKPLFPTIATQLLDFIGDSELIIHNAPFDLSFLHYELNLLSEYRNFRLDHRCRIMDTMLLASEKLGGQFYSLDKLCRRFSIDNSAREKHGALLDAQLLAQVYCALTQGQTDLTFTASHAQMTPEKTKVKLNLSATDYAHCLLLPTATEMQAHENYLTDMEKDGNNCIWRKLEE